MKNKLTLTICFIAEISHQCDGVVCHVGFPLQKDFLESQLLEGRLRPQ